MVGSPYHSRVEDLYSGPWITDLKDCLKLWPKKVFLEALEENTLSAEVDKCRDAIRDNLAFIELISAAIRSGYVPLEMVRENIVSLLQPFEKNSAAYSYLVKNQYGGVIDLASRIGMRPYVSDFSVRPIDGDLQVYFAFLLATHREIRNSPQLRLAYDFLNVGYVDATSIPTDYHGPLAHYELRTIPRLTITSLVASIDNKDPSLEKELEEDSMPSIVLASVIGFVHTISRLYSPMDEVERGVLGSIYLRTFENLLRSQIAIPIIFRHRTAPAEYFHEEISELSNSPLAKKIGRFEPLKGSFAGKLPSCHFLFRRDGIGGESQLRADLKVIRDTLVSVKGTFFDPNNGWSGGGGGGKPSNSGVNRKLATTDS